MSIAALIIVNTALCIGVIATVVAPLVWAILTQQRDTEAVVAQRRRRVRTAAASQRRAPRPQYRPVTRPA
jgi:ABC-type glycerol-3-phosphate transport system permease component